MHKELWNEILIWEQEQEEPKPPSVSKNPGRIDKGYIWVFDFFLEIFLDFHKYIIVNKLSLFKYGTYLLGTTETNFSPLFKIIELLADCSIQWKIIEFPFEVCIY